MVMNLRKILRAGSIVFGLSAIALVFAPALFIQLLGLSSTSALEWSMRMTGVTLVALAGNMFSHSSRGSDAAVILASKVMAVGAAGLGVLTLVIPAAFNWFSICYAVIGFSFSVSYTMALLAGGVKANR